LRRTALKEAEDDGKGTDARHQKYLGVMRTYRYAAATKEEDNPDRIGTDRYFPTASLAVEDGMKRSAHEQHFGRCLASEALQPRPEGCGPDLNFDGDSALRGDICSTSVPTFLEDIMAGPSEPKLVHLSDEFLTHPHMFSGKKPVRQRHWQKNL
jgi:hypothetical protein